MKRLWSAGPRRTRTSRLTRPVQSRPWPCHRKSNRKSIRLRSLICDPDSILLKSDRGNLLPFGGAHRDAVPRASPHALRAPLTNTPPAELGIYTLKPPYCQRASWRCPCRPLQPRPGCARANARGKIFDFAPPAPLQDKLQRAARVGVGQTHGRESPDCAPRPAMPSNPSLDATRRLDERGRVHALAFVAMAGPVWEKGEQGLRRPT